MRPSTPQSPLSMTATGLADFESGGRRYLVELKSLNSRGLDLKCLLPEELARFEIPLRASLSARLTRGKVELRVKPQAATPALSLNQGRVDEYIALHLALSEKLSSVGPRAEGLSAAQLLHWPQVLDQPTLSAQDAEALYRALGPALERALTQLLEMRAVEGAALYTALLEHVEQMRAQVQSLSALIPELSAQRAEALRTRLSALLEAQALSPDEPRLQTELALLADRADVTEELKRLSAHLDHLCQLLSSGAPSGRRCDFLCQELLREANTASSKLHEVEVTHLLVELKAEIERLREQLQNIE